MQLFVEDWASTYQSPYLVVEEDTGAEQVELLEDGGELAFHEPLDEIRAPLAFVDGVRRAEATLYLIDPSGHTARGIAGAHACGAVLVEHGCRPVFDACTVKRIAVWGSGQIADLEDVDGGWSWSAHSVATDEPTGPLQELQRRMRQAEGILAETLCGQGFLTVVDGPLNFVRSRDLPVVGFVKTHHRQLLPGEHHVRVPGLAPGQRTTVFRTRPDVYSAYLRLDAGRANAGPWSGIVRLEAPASPGLREVVRVVDQLAGSLPRFAGVAHIDPRAPQNLQPIGALETHLRHLLGDANLATRAVRSAIREVVPGDVL